MRLCASAVLAIAASACAGAPAPRANVAVVAVGERAKVAEEAVVNVDVGVDLRVVRVPTAIGSPLDPLGRLRASDVELALAAARTDYLSGELGRVRSCAEKLGDPELVWSSLARRGRHVASRVLVWRIACSSIVRHEDAVAAGQTFAALGLELPTDVDAIPVEAHKILTASLTASESASKRAVSVRTEPSNAEIVIDGRATCASPCKVDLSVGDHHVSAEKRGFSAAARVIRVEAAGPTASLEFALAPASPELAAAQWASTYGVSRARSDDSEAISLLGKALRARKLVFLDAEPLGDGVRIRGALSIDGRVEARSERPGPSKAATRDVLEDLLVKGGVVEGSSVFKKPLFWIAVAVGAAASAAITTFVLYDPGTRTEVRTR